MAKRSGTISVVFLRALVHAVRESGADAKRFMTEAGIDPTILDDDEARVARDVSMRAWTLAPIHTGDADFGLHVAERMPTGAYGVLEYAVRSSSNVGDALARVARYYRLLSDSSELRMELVGDAVRVVHPTEPGTPRGVADCILATLAFHGRVIVDPPVVTREVAFSYPRPASTVEHERIFQAPLRFDAKEDEILFDATALARPLLSANNALCAVLVKHADAMLAQRTEADPLLERVRAAIASTLTSGSPTIRTIARAMHTSERSLQRSLQERGTTHQEIVDSLRHELALRYLGEESVTIAHVGFLLGFSDTSAFYRAFRRWTGKTPKEHREAAG